MTPNSKVENLDAVSDQATAVDQQDKLKKLTWAMYIAFAVAPFSGGLSAVVGLILNYMKKSEAEGTSYEEHFSWLRSTFWWSLVLGFIALVLTFVGIGIFLGMGLGVWYLYRMIKGMLCLYESKPLKHQKA